MKSEFKKSGSDLNKIKDRYLRDAVQSKTISLFQVRKDYLLSQILFKISYVFRNVIGSVDFKQLFIDPKKSLGENKDLLDQFLNTSIEALLYSFYNYKKIAS